KHVATCGEFGDQRLEVINLPVEHDANGAILVEQRLNATGKIDDRETAMPEANAGRVVKPFAIRSAMTNGVGHPATQSTIDLRITATVKNARNSTHSIRPS